MALSVTGIAPINVDSVWPLVAEGIARSCIRSGGDLSPGNLWIACRTGQAFLIVAHDENAVIAASIWLPDEWANGMRLRCAAVYGRNMKTWIGPMREVVTSIARACGAVALVSDGRPGWQRIFPRARVLRVVYEEPV